MSPKVRTLLAALIVLIAALAGALFLGYRTGMQSAQTSFEGGTDVASIDLQSLLGQGSSDERLVDFAFHKVEEAFYEPVQAQTLLDGEHKGLVEYLSSKHVRAALPAASASGIAATDRAKLNEELALAEERYGAKFGNTELTQAAISGMMDALKDPYTVYLSPHEIQSLDESLDGGNFGGIGVYIVQDNKGEVLVDPIEDLPAARAGMKPGEVVLDVDGHSTSGLKLDTVERMIRGTAGTTVRITTHPYKKADRRSYAIVRETIHVPTVKAKMEDGFDYIRLSDFGDTSSAEIKRALLFGKRQGAKGYILDLRDNGGGLLDAAVDISSYFVPSGPIVSMIDRAGNRDTKDAEGDAVGGTAPLVVLVNKYTASASEITSGAIQDYHVGKLVGTRTFGKGVVQSIYRLQDGGALKITTARYVTPLGRDIQHKGIEPDVVVTQSPDPSLIDTPGDRQLSAAKALLREAAAQGKQ